jgi:predicted nucleic acid-binding protein
MEIMVDASAIIDCITDEDEVLAARIGILLKGHDIVAPEVLPFEIGNSLSSLIKRRRLLKYDAQDVFNSFRDVSIKLYGIDMDKALKIFVNYSCYAYDAYYLEVASRLKIPLLTLDTKMIKNGKDMGVTILEVAKC